MEKDEISLVRAGVRAAIAHLSNGLHSEDDHGFDLARWLESQEDKITESACGKIDSFRAKVVD